MSKGVVLLIDDETVFVDTMSKRFKRRGYTVYTANTGAEGLNELSIHPDIDAAVIDVKMPGMDGIATLREIKKLYPLVEVIMLTGHATIETAIDGMKYGAFDYLMKIADIELLLQKITAAIERKRLHEERLKTGA